ncbi:MAG: hypothetical protein LBP34_01105 [Flavobacteriaceae bacterium]|jgi:hypothetical protein|nr:hypothetical protein [Flavobacteriaceae bacterium]
MKIESVSILVFFLLTLFLGCENKGIKIEKYPSGDIHYEYYGSKNKLDSVYEYFEDGKSLKMKITQISKDKQYITHFDKSGKGTMGGWAAIKDGKTYREGWWTQIQDKEKIKVEYVIVGDSFVENQIKFLGNLDTVQNQYSLYYRINLPDTIVYGKNYKFIIELVTPIVGDEGTYNVELYLSEEIPPNYLNVRNLKNSYDIKKTGINIWEVNHTFKQKGDFILRGYIIRRWIDSKMKNRDSIEIINNEGITYIKKEIYVK